MVRRDIDRRPAASCPRCHGLWISGPALAETRLPVEQVPHESRRPGPPPPDAGPRRCPQCDALMRSETHAGLTIERCAACASVWLDAGEFDAVRRVLQPTSQAPTGPRLPTLAEWTAFDAFTEAALWVLPSLLDG
jgi:Zn-finger nucleic acid-binding protein